MFDQITLSNGLRIIGEPLPHFRSVSVGLWVRSGSQYETAPEAGVSHFIEHLVFKGTENRSARQIAEEMDAVGGHLNAFTTKECTCFYTKVVDERLELAIDTLFDMALRPAFDPVELDKERGVVQEEIAMAEDEPEDVAGELIMLAHYGDQPVSRPILGTDGSIAAMPRDVILDYWRRMYRPGNAVLAVAGHYDWDNVVALAEKYMGNWTDEGRESPEPANHSVPPYALAREKDIEQVHICLGYPGISAGDGRTYELAELNSVFGGAMSSRLFQKVREEMGVAYSVYSYPNSYGDTGMLAVYAATNPETAEEVLDTLESEARLMAERGLTEQEFRMAREQLRSSYILGLESTSHRMQAIGRRLLMENSTRTEEEVIRRIESLRLEDVNALAKELLSAPHSTAMVGRNAKKYI